MKKLSALFLIATFIFSACGSSYKVDVDLTNEEINEIKTTIEQLKEDINNFEGTKDQIPHAMIVDLARSYEKIGELSKAIKVYKDVLDDGHRTHAIVNNLAHLYDDVEEYENAIVIYQRLIDEYFEMKYLRNIVWDHINLGNRKEAEKYFNVWQLEFQRTDMAIQQAIKKLREKEKMSEL